MTVTYTLRTISGTIFEDSNYGGGSGRDSAAAAGVGRSGARVELYNNSGVFVTSTTSQTAGAFAFASLSSGNYTVRVVNDSVSSARTGYTSSLKGVQTYRTNASSGSAVAVSDYVGGQNPAVADAAAGSAGATMNTTTGVFSVGPSGTGQSITNVTVGASDIMDVDFGYCFDVIVNTNNSGQGSVRQFILNANALLNTGLAQSGQVGGKDNAIWMISNGTSAAGLRATNNYFTSGIATISPTSALPTVTFPAVLDAQQQPGWLSVPIIELNGTGATGAKGLLVTGGATVLRGLVINRFPATGIELTTAGSDTVQGCYVGTNAAGTAASANGVHGIYASGITNNLIGGTGTATGNVVSGNTQIGIYFDNADNSTIAGNYVGTGASGTTDLNGSVSNTFESGIVLTNGSSGNTIGGTTTAARNVLSGNNHFGFEVLGATSQNNVVQGNFIGTTVSGLAALPNVNGGASFWGAGSGNVVGGNTASARNVISANTGYGVLVGSAATSATIQGNYIGVGADGTTALGNSGSGISVEGASTNTRIGTDANGTNDAAEGNIVSGNTYGITVTDNGTTGTIIAGNTVGLAGDGTTIVANSSRGVSVLTNASSTVIGGTTSVSRNVISGNASFGVYLGGTTSGTRVLSNYIGTNAAGTAARANLDGVWIDGSGGNTIGQSASGNLISGNTYYGVVVDAATATADTIRANLIGLDAAGTSSVANGAHGIWVSNGATGTLIGGTTAGMGNTVAFNAGDGINVANASVASILGNVIRANTDLGIDLDTNGVNLNNGTKTAGLSNSDMDFPVFTSAYLNGTSLSVTGYVGSAPSQPTFASARVELFKSDNDATGYGEGSSYLGALTADASGNFTGTLTVSGLAPGDKVTATATDGTNNTSEFGADSTVRALSLVKRVFASNGSALASGATLAKGTLVQFLLYVDNRAGAVTDVRLSDVLDPAFAYVAGTMRAANVTASCTSTTCTSPEESAILADALAGVALTDAADGDTGALGGLTIQVGKANAGSARLDIAANKVYAIVFRARMR